ncbi:MAG: MarR family transcriptional regulator [Pseudomonadota bacterium]
MPASRLAEPAALDDLLLYRVSRLRAVAGGMVVRLCEGRFGITWREWRVLASLAREEGLLSSQLAERAQLDRARTSRAIGSLAGKGLLLREAGRADRRQARLSLTPQGQALFGALFPIVRDLNLELLNALSGTDIAQLDRVLGLLQARAETMALQAELPKASRHRGGRARLPSAA